MEIISRKTLYGMYVDPVYFIKVYLRDPYDITKIANVLEESALCGIMMQAYECHIPYLLKFTSDYNIQPMGWMHVSAAKFRQPLPPDDPEFPPPTKAAGISQGMEFEWGSPLLPMTALNESVAMLSPITASGGKHLKSPDLSEPSPIQLDSSQGREGGAFESPAAINKRGAELRCFTQSTVPANLIWSQEDAAKFLCLGESTPAQPTALDRKTTLELELEQLFDGVTADTFVWSQYPQVGAQSTAAAAVLPAAAYPPLLQKESCCELEIPPLLQKESCCELEIDVHERHIMNVHMVRAAFGEELWEEERARCRQRGVEFEEAAPPAPFTQSIHREAEESEVEFRQRYNNLLRKGAALRDVAVDAQTSRYAEISSGELDAEENAENSAAVLSYSNGSSLARIFSHHCRHPNGSFLVDGSVGNEKDLNASDGKSEHDAELRQWASKKLQESEDSASFEMTQMQLDFQYDVRDSVDTPALGSFDLDDALDEKDRMPSDKGQFLERGNDAIGDAGPADDDVHPSQEHILQEVDDILGSTQPQHQPHDLLPPEFRIQQRPGRIELRYEEEEAPALEGMTPTASILKRANASARVEKETGLKAFEAGLVTRRDLKRRNLASVFHKRKRRTADVDSQQSEFSQDQDSDVAACAALEEGEGEIDCFGQADVQEQQKQEVDDWVPIASDRLVAEPQSALETPGKRRIKRSVTFAMEPDDGAVSISTEAAVMDASPAAAAAAAAAAVSKPAAALPPSAPHILVPTFQPPLLKDLAPLRSYGLLDVLNTPAHFSRREDAEVVGRNEKSTLIAKRHPIKFEGDCEAFDGGFPRSPFLDDGRQVHGAPPRRRCLIPTFSAPSPALIWKLEAHCKPLAAAGELDRSQIATPTQTAHSGGSDELAMNAGGSAMKRMCRLTVMSIEVYCHTRSALLPNPRHDAVQAIFYVVDDVMTDADSECSRRVGGVICQIQPPPITMQHVHRDASKAQMRILQACGLPSDTDFTLVIDEQELFRAFFRKVAVINPDFFVGYEVTNLSLGYLVKRGKQLNIDVLQEVSKMPKEKASFQNETEPGGQQESGLFITGRIVLNMWQRMRDELKLFSYTFSNVAAHLLHRRVPFFSFQQRTRWFRPETTRFRTVRYVYQLALLNLLLMEKNDFVRRVSESARLYGIDFFSVISRGSQYRVEAALLIKAHNLGYLLLSPSRRKVASQAPMECIPLVMEPQSNFYADPVVVLDFQSLYPSMMIAHNLCFSTIFGKFRTGRMGAVETTEKLGVVDYPEAQSAAMALLHGTTPFQRDERQLSNQHYVSPNGAVFCSPSVRQGILPMMVKEMLEARLMVKRAMKRYKNMPNTHVLQRVLDARQLAIKLLANVTYGYTAAGFSGRMPMAELADSIVQSGRSTLEWTIRQINSHPEWRARVVYGDTDSVFVELKGRTLEEAFTVGQEISQYITARTPDDVLLKFEKVYFPSILVTKKRYVGNCFEAITQKVPHLDAKGIEVVRRDQCPAAVKIQEKCIRLLFESRDMSQVKAYLMRQWDKMLQGGDKLLLRDFIFQKEVRFGHYASVSSQPPGAIVATKAVVVDEMAVPVYNWRVPYIVVHGVPGAPLKDLVCAPEELLRRGSALRLNYVYYIEKCINPALERVLSLCGADVWTWYRSIHKPKARLRHIQYVNPEAEARRFGVHLVGGAYRDKQTTMEAFTTQGSCSVCGDSDAQPRRTLCASCASRKASTYVVLQSRLQEAMVKDRELAMICQNCSKCPQPSTLMKYGEMTGADCCESIDCIVFFERARCVTRIEDLQQSVAEIE